MSAKISRIILCLAALAMAGACLAGCDSTPKHHVTSEVIRFEVQDHAIPADLLAILNGEGDTTNLSGVTITFNGQEDLSDPEIKKILEKDKGTITSSEDLTKVLDYFRKGDYSIEIRVSKEQAPAPGN